MNYLKLSQICSINMGQSPESASYNEEGNGLPFFQGNSDFGDKYPRIRIWCTSPKKIAKAGDILVSVRAPIGAINVANVDCCIGRGLSAISPNKEVSSEYIFWLLKSLSNYLNSKGTGSTFKAINKAVLEGILVPDLGKEKQQIIANCLETLQKITSLRRRQLNKLNSLIKARFVEMFGDPLVNSRGFKLQSYGDVFDLNAGGTPSKNHPEYWIGGNISWIGSNMCRDSIIYKNDGQFINREGLNHSSARIFPPGTVLIALVGATIGKTALLEFETTTNQNVLGIHKIEEAGYTPEFVFCYTQGLHKKFTDMSDGGFSMASKKFISSLPLPVVSKNEQKNFSSFFWKVDKSKVVVQKALDKAQQLFDSLMQEYFG